ALERSVVDALRDAGADEVHVAFAASFDGAAGPEALPGIRHLVAVGSGKGGVGKSTVAANLAAALAVEGAAVGLLDADIYGPSQAKMFAVEGKRLMADEEKRILPLRAHGVKLISIANLVEDGQALTWRGPILHGTLKQMLEQTVWGELDVMIVDLPPGTGDVQLSLTQLATVSGAVLVTTPQEMSLADVRRAHTMMRKTHVPVLGAIENMSWYELPDGARDPIFGEGAARAWCEAERVPLLGQVPISRSVRESGDDGTPLVLSHPDTSQAHALRFAARALGRRLAEQARNTLPVV
ncbi:MAG: Mrp/NBP35 family ATP-binding protein, partial [Trueperaceae bacterium]